MSRPLLISIFIFCFAFGAAAQAVTPAATRLPAVTKVDGVGLKALIAPKQRPVLVNFWATYCDPCRDEFPDLVKIAADYKGRIDVITVSLDDVADIDGAVPMFLASMGADMPAYLLSTSDEDGLISSISKEWGGGLPFTVVYDSAGKLTYQKLGKFKPAVLRQAIDQVVAPSAEKP